MKLSEIAHIIGGELIGSDLDIHINAVSIDTRTMQRGDYYVALPGEQYDGNQFLQQAIDQGAVAAIVTKGDEFHIPVIKVKDALKAMTQLAKHHRQQMGAKVLGISGSCGKTTTRVLLQSICESAGKTLASVGSFNNHIGVPLTMLKLNADHDFYVQELGANHLGEISELTHLLKPDVAALTMASVTHLEGFGDLQSVACAEGEIFQGLQQNGCAVINRDDNYADFWTKLAGSHEKKYFSVKEKANTYASNIELVDGMVPQFMLHCGEQSTTVTLQLLGEHNVQNAVCAAAAASAVGISMQHIKLGLERATAEKHRMRLLKGLRGARIIDDAYNSSPAAIKAAIDWLVKQTGRKILVMGDMKELGKDEHAYHREIGQYALQQGIDRLYAVGQLVKYAVDAFGHHAYHYRSKEELIHDLQTLLADDLVVLVKASNSCRFWEIAESMVETGE